MRPGRGAAVGVVTKGVNVESALGVGVAAGNVPGDAGGSRLGLLLKDDGAVDRSEEHTSELQSHS